MQSMICQIMRLVERRFCTLHLCKRSFDVKGNTQQLQYLAVTVPFGIYGFSVGESKFTCSVIFQNTSVIAVHLPSKSFKYSVL